MKANTMVEPHIFSREFENDDGFEGSMDEQRIFSEVFFGSDGSRKRGYIILDTTTTIDCDSFKQKDWSLCPNSGKSSLTSQDAYEKEDFVGKHPLESLSVDFSLSIKGKHELKLLAGDLPDAKPDLEDNLIASAPSEGIVSCTSQENSGSACHTLAYRVVESSGQGVTSSIYQLKSLVYVDKGCEISGRGSSKNGASSLDHNDLKESVNRAVTSPISQESHATKLLFGDPLFSVANKLATHRPTKPKWKDSCFLKLDEEELAMPKDIKNDPRPLLRYHINRLLRAAGWVIGRRKRNSKYNGIGEYVYKSPGGRPIREFYRAWCMCGGSLLANAAPFMQASDCMEWADMMELWADLSRTVKDIEDKLNLLETTSAMAQLWCLLDPFANVVFIEKTIRLLKEGITVKAKRSLVIPSETGSAAKYQKISRSEKGSLDSRTLQDWGYAGTHQIGIPLFDVPVGSGAPQFLGVSDPIFPQKESAPTSPCFDPAKDEEEGSFGYIRKVHKKSRKISEMKPTGNYFGGRDHLAVGKISSARCGSKKSKPCRLNDNDLLISAIIKTKTSGDNKWSSCNSKPLRKRKTPKGSCRLLLRSLKKGAKHIMEGKWSAFGSRTVFSWLIYSGVLSLNDVIQYRNLKDDAVIKDGLIARDGVYCNCCNKVLPISEFKSHAGFKSNRPCANLFMESGKPFTLCQLEAWSAEYKARKVTPKTDHVDEVDQNDDSCGRCGDVGELICCDNCPSAFHQACLYEQDLPEGNWYCPQCRCQVCGDAVNDKENSQLHGDLKCSQCEDKYHATCMQQMGMKVGLASETWFCGDSCHKVYAGLQSRIGLKNLLSDGFSWTLLRCIPGDQKVHSTQRVVALKAECNSKLAVAITIMEECFLPMVDIKTGIDMIPQVMYNWGSQFSRLNYSGFYTVVLEKDDVILSVASIRIHGVEVAELPLIGTCSKNRRQGMCRRLVNSIEEMLKSLKVKKLVISAIPTLVETWTVGFGFQPLEEYEKQSLSRVNLMVFPGAVWLKKQLYKTSNMDERTCENTTSDSAEVGACERGPHAENGLLSDDNLSIPEDNFETGIYCGAPENSQRDGHSSGILQNQPALLAIKEPNPATPPYKPFNKNINTTMTRNIVETMRSKVDEQECRQPNDCDSAIEAANIPREATYCNPDNLQSVLCFNGFTEQHSGVQRCGILQSPGLKVSLEEVVVSLPPGNQLEVAAGPEPEEMLTERLKQCCLFVENNASER